MKQETFEVVKELVGAVVGAGAAILCGMLTGNVVNSSCSNKLTKLFALIGGAAIGSMVSEKAADYTKKAIDDYASVATETKKLVETIKEETERAGEVNV